MAPEQQPAPILRVTVGVPVYSADDQKLGKVKEIREAAFQVETGLFQKDYWLPGETVAEAVPEHSVVLTIPKGELDTHKLSSEPSAA
jgi:hypothetical protein